MDFSYCGQTHPIILSIRSPNPVQSIRTSRQLINVDSNAVTPVVEPLMSLRRLRSIMILQKQIDAERAKPLNEQDYSSIKEGLQEIIRR